MPQNQDFGFELASRLEAVAQHANEKRPIAIMRPSCSDSLLILPDARYRVQLDAGYEVLAYTVALLR